MNLRYLSTLGILFMLALPNASSAQNFVAVEGPKFMLDGKPYFYIGANFWQGMNLGSKDPSGNRDRLLRELDRLKKLGVTNLRVLAGSEGPDGEALRVRPAMQSAPGVYNPDVVEGLDFLLTSMSDRNMKAVMCLSNFWPWSGGMAQYVAWAEGSAIPYPTSTPGGSWETYQDYTAKFYRDGKAKDLFDNHVRYLVNRRNSLTGVAYKDDPTIMAWELANEPRSRQYPTEYREWIRRSAALIKTLDPHHLVTIGSEGNIASPGSANGYLTDHSIKDIDYGTIHIWVENWGWYNPEGGVSSYQPALQKALSYVDQHLKLSEPLAKPMVLEEFGMARDNRDMNPNAKTLWRDRYYQALFDKVFQEAFAGSSLVGANFWAWSGEGRPEEPYGDFWSLGQDLLGDPPHEEQGWYGVYDADASTLKIIHDATEKMSSL